MTAEAKDLQARLGELPESDRAAIAHFLLVSLEETNDEDAEAAWDIELERRAAEIRSGAAEGEPAEKVFSDLRDKHG